MNNVEKIKPTGLFTNYIYKAIPLAFDESMSYYETLCGLLSYLKDTVIPALNNNADAIVEVQNLMTELQNYVNNYFDNLDVQEEINNKLDEMAEDGILTNILQELNSINKKYPLYNGGETATVSTVTNVDNLLEVPTAPHSESQAIRYGHFDNVIQTIYGSTEYNHVSSSGYIRQINTENITQTTIQLLQDLPENYVKENMFVTLNTSDTPTNNFSYVGLIDSYNPDTYVLTVKNGWYNKTTGVAELPVNVSYAWINPLTKLYGQNFSLHNNNENLVNLVGSQCDIYGNGTEDIVGYSPVLRSSDGFCAFRSRSEQNKWQYGMRFEGEYDNLINLNSKSIIDGRGYFCNLGLQISNQNVVSPNVSLWLLNEDIDIRNINFIPRSLYFIYNNSNSEIEIQGRFIVSPDTTNMKSSITVNSRELIPIFANSETTFLILRPFLNSNKSIIEINQCNSSDLIALNQNTDLNTLIGNNIKNGETLKVHFIINSNDNITITAQDASIFLNGGTLSHSETLKSRTSGDIIISKTSGGYVTYYINSVQ